MSDPGKSGPPATLEALLGEMGAKKSVLGGWAAAFCLSEKAVVELAGGAWPALSRLSLPAAGLELELGERRLGLDGDGCRLLLRQEVLRGTRRRGPGGPAVELGPAHLEGWAPLVLAEAGAGSRALALDLSELRLALVGGGRRRLAGRPLAAAFAEGRTRVELAAFDLLPDTRQRRMQITSLLLHSATTSSGRPMLQLLVGSGGDIERPGVDLGEPVPVESGADYSLIADSRIVFSDLVTEFNAKPGLVKLVAVPPAPGENGAWTAQVRSPMSFGSRVTWGRAIAPIESHAVMGLRLAGADGGLVLSSYLDPSSNLSPQLTVSGTFPLVVSGAGASQELRLGAGGSSIEARGVAELNVKPQLESFLGGDIRPNLESLSFAQITGLLFDKLALPLHLPRIDAAHLPGDLLLAGRLERKADHDEDHEAAERGR